MFSEEVFLNVLQSCPDFEYVEFDGEEFFFKVEPQYANFEHTILDALEDAGVELNFEQQQTKDSGIVMGGTITMKLLFQMP